MKPVALLGAAVALLLSAADGYNLCFNTGRECVGNQFVGMLCTGLTRLQSNFPALNAVHETNPPSTCATRAAAQTDAQMLVSLGFDYTDCAVATATAIPEERPAFVAGYLAGLVSSSKVTGVVGGMSLPSVQRFFNGFLVGVRTSCPECRVEGMYVNSFDHPANAEFESTFSASTANQACGCGWCCTFILTGIVAPILVNRYGTPEDQDTFNDLWLYNVQSAKWLNGDHGMTTGAPPPPLAKACAVALGSSVVVFGGRGQDVLTDILAFLTHVGVTLSLLMLLHAAGLLWAGCQMGGCGTFSRTKYAKCPKALMYWHWQPRARTRLAGESWGYL